MNFRSLALVGAAAALMTLPAVVTTTAVAKPKSVVQCMTDDGYGRFRPCDASYKAAHPNWRGTDACMTDDGYGRYRPCDAGYKAKHQK
jgi:hypothetical protein